MSSQTSLKFVAVVTAAIIKGIVVIIYTWQLFFYTTGRPTARFITIIWYFGRVVNTKGNTYIRLGNKKSKYIIIIYCAKWLFFIRSIWPLWEQISIINDIINIGLLLLCNTLVFCSTASFVTDLFRQSIEQTRFSGVGNKKVCNRDIDSVQNGQQKKWSYLQFEAPWFCMCFFCGVCCIGCHTNN